MVENKPDAVESALEKMTPFLTNVTFGGMMGYTTGYAMKKISKAVAFFVGVTFVALQTGVYCGYIDVDWMKIKDSAFQTIDAVRLRATSCLSSLLQSYVIPCSLTPMFLSLPGCGRQAHNQRP
jgi:uncharacterized membrane protein (Fun14 family)